MSRFIWEEDEDEGVTVTQADSPLAEMEAEIAKVSAQLRAAGVTEAEEEELAAEPYGKEEA